MKKALAVIAVLGAALMIGATAAAAPAQFNWQGVICVKHAEPQFKIPVTTCSIPAVPLAQCPTTYRAVEADGVTAICTLPGRYSFEISRQGIWENSPPDIPADAHGYVPVWRPTAADANRVLKHSPGAYAGAVCTQLPATTTGPVVTCQVDWKGPVRSISINEMGFVWLKVK